MVSRPDFKVEVVKGNQQLVFQCFFVNPEESEPESQSQEEYGEI